MKNLIWFSPEWWKREERRTEQAARGYIGPTVDNYETYEKDRRRKMKTETHVPVSVKLNAKS